MIIVATPRGWSCLVPCRRSSSRWLRWWRRWRWRRSCLGRRVGRQLRGGSWVVRVRWEWVLLIESIGFGIARCSSCWGTTIALVVAMDGGLRRCISRVGLGRIESVVLRAHRHQRATIGASWTSLAVWSTACGGKRTICAYSRGGIQDIGGILPRSTGALFRARCRRRCR